jgi:subtilase family serine protease
MDLGPGGGLTFTVEVTGASTAGSATLQVQVDQTAAITEFSEGNNVLSETTTINS